jgi:glutathione peroxidase
VIFCLLDINKRKVDNTIYQFNFTTPSGKSLSTADLSGKVILIVNTATKCGHTPQLITLEKLYNKYKDQGLLIIGFPSDQFAQEPLEGEDISEFCSINYGVTFPMMQKTKLKGEDAHPIFKFFASKSKNGAISSVPRWNFYKYLIGRDGKVIDYFWTYRKPDNAKFVRAIEKALDSREVAANVVVG